MGYMVDLIFDKGDTRIATYPIAAKTEAEALIEAKRWLLSARSMARLTGSSQPVAYSLVADGEVIKSENVKLGTSAPSPDASVSEAGEGDGDLAETAGRQSSARERRRRS